MVVAIMTFSKNAFIALSIKFRFLSESRLIIIKDKEILVHVSFFSDYLLSTKNIANSTACKMII